MINLSQAKKQAIKYQNAAQAIVDHYKFKEAFGSLGKFEYEGSYRYELMVKPDIDAHIFVQNIDKVEIAKLAHDYLLRDDIVRVMVMDHQIHIQTLKPRPGFPPGVYFGLRLAWEGELWNIDIWILRPEDKKDPGFFKSNGDIDLTNDQRDQILLLKYQLKEANLYTTEFGGADVYRAVVQDNIKTVDQMKVWRKTHPFY